MRLNSNFHHAFCNKSEMNPVFLISELNKNFLDITILSVIQRQTFNYISEDIARSLNRLSCKHCAA